MGAGGQAEEQLQVVWDEREALRREVLSMAKLREEVLALQSLWDRDNMALTDAGAACCKLCCAIRLWCSVRQRRGS